MTPKERKAMVDLLGEIDRKAEAGLCQFSLSGARAFHEDIRLIVKEALEATEVKS